MKKNRFDKYNFNNVSIQINSKNSIFEFIKNWIIIIYKFIINQWKYNRLAFLFVLSLLFLFIYYIYVNDIREETDINKYKNENETLNNFVKTNLKNKKKRIPKKHETRCRIILEKLFKSPFITIRPDFLKYDKTGKNLELDMFNQDLMIALEYDGIHHRKYTEFFHKSEQDFIEQKERDNFKEEKCKELGITLIRVPDTVKYEDLEIYIKNELDKRGIFYFK